MREIESYVFLEKEIGGLEKERDGDLGLGF